MLPVTDVDRSKVFHEGLGFRLDADFSTNVVCGSSSSPRRDPPPRSSSVSTSLMPHRAPCADCTSSAPTWNGRSPSSGQAAPTSPGHGTAPTASSTAPAQPTALTACTRDSYASFASFADPDGNG
jgi:hypothetical protein